MLLQQLLFIHRNICCHVILSSIGHVTAIKSPACGTIFSKAVQKKIRCTFWYHLFFQHSESIKPHDSPTQLVIALLPRNTSLIKHITLSFSYRAALISSTNTFKLVPSYEARRHHTDCRQCYSHGRHVGTIENCGKKYQEGRRTFSQLWLWVYSEI
jgi:hypothetical protein